MEIIIGIAIAIAVGFICLIGIGVLVYWASEILIPAAIIVFIFSIIARNEKWRIVSEIVFVVTIVARFFANYLNDISSQIWR